MDNGTSFIIVSTRCSKSPFTYRSSNMIDQVSKLRIAWTLQCAFVFRLIKTQILVRFIKLDLFSECMGMFSCDNSYCIPESKVCDLERNCWQGGDEICSKTLLFTCM